ncbi:hypothetical protein V8F20_004651 [Naviculisporaceae sp. PSN 640]
MDDTQETPAVREPYEPTVLDVIVVKEMLHKALNLPPELVDSIVDLAEYWPHTTTEIDYTQRNRLMRKDARGGHPSENSFLLRTPPLGFVRPPYSSPEDVETPPPPQLLEDEFEPKDFQNLIASPVKTIAHPCRKIVFTFASHDQGWGNPGGEGLYTDSWTWFEVGLERCNKKKSAAANEEDTARTPKFDLASLATLDPPIRQHEDSEVLYFHFPLLPRDDRQIQSNVTVHHDTKEHKVVWSYQDNVKAASSLPPLPADDDSETEGGNSELKSTQAASNDEDNGESSADGAAGPVFESPAVKALAEIGRGKATGDGEFVRNLKLGDIVTVWAKARFAGWVNYVDRVKVDVYWAI